jgi:DNA polymerase-3 subunit delta
MAAPLTFDSAYRRIRRGDLDPVYYLTGDEDVLKDELIALLVDAVVDDGTRDFNLDVRAAADVDAETFNALVETPPMLAERRLVVVRHVDQWRKNSKVWQVLEAYVARPSPTTVLVMTAGSKTVAALTKGSTHVPIQPLRPDRLLKWVAMRAERAGVAFSEEAVEHLVAAVGPDLAFLGMEIEKLATASTGEPLTPAVVADFVGVRQGETVDDWVAAVLMRDIPRALRLVRPVLSTAGTSGVRLLISLGPSLLGLAIARSLLDAGRRGRDAERAIMDHLKAARPFGLGPWGRVATDWVRWAPRWSPDELEEAMRAAWEADRALKSTTITDEAGVLSDMLLKLSVREAA